MMAYLRHHYFLVHAYPKDINKVTINDITSVSIFRVSVPNVERQIQLRASLDPAYKLNKKWEYLAEDSYLEYPIIDSDLVLRVFKTFLKSIDHII